MRRAAEFLALLLTRSGKPEPASGRSAIDDPTDDDSLLTDSGFLQRFVTRPAVLLTAGLIVVAAVAEHSLFGGGPLGGGALVPAWEGASSLWGEVLGAFHPVGIGSASAAPPSAGFVALLASLLLGKTWLAVDVLLLGCVPLAGFTALLALRKVTRSAAIRVWGAASYALLPVAFGAVSAGRLGSAVAFVLIPLIGLAAGRLFTEPPRLARRAAWAVGLIVMIGTAFVPVLWLMAVVAAGIAAIVLRRSTTMLVNLVIVAATPLVLLLPWMLQMLAHPSRLLLEAGVQEPGLATANLPARALLLLSPGGPGLPPYWVSAALLLIALAALAAPRRRTLVMAGWAAALLGLATAVVMSRTTVTPPGGQAITPWPGPALAVAAAGLVLAGAAAADGLGRVLGNRGRTGLRRFAGARGLPIAVLGLAAVSAPVLAAAYWLVHPVTGPVAPATGEIVPSLASISGSPGRQLRTLVLSSSGGHVSYLLLRGTSPQFADSGLIPVGTAQDALSTAVASLVAPGGGLAASQSQQLARFDIGYVLVQTPASAQLVSTLNGVAGLSFLSRASGYDLWKLATLPARVSVVEPSGAVVAVNSGPVAASGAAPAAGGILELAEPAGGWHAALNGHALTPVRSPAGSWAQAFRLPPGGGTVTISRSGFLHDLITGIELLAIVVVAVLALPGVRTAAELEAAAEARAQLEQDAAAAEETTRTAPAGPRSSGEQSQPGKPGARRGRAAPARGRARSGRRKPAPAAADSVAAEPASRARGDRPALAATGRTAALRPGRRHGKAEDAAAAGAAAAEVAAAGLAGAAAGRAAASASGRAAASTAAASTGVTSTSATSTGASDKAGSASADWPGGQPGSKFSGGPPARRQSRPDGDSASRQHDDRLPARWDSGADTRRPLARPGLSPSGSGFDDLPAPDPRPSGRHDRHKGDGGGGRIRIRRRRGDEAAQRDQQPGRRRDERPSSPAPPVSGRSPSGSPYPDEPQYPGRDADRRGAEPGSDWRPDRRRSGSGWRTAEPSAWGADDDPSGWPEPRSADGWPQEGRHGSGRRGVPGQAQWTDEADELEALPPAGEVHHDWPRRAERRTRGWIAPGDDADGESW